MFEVTQPRVTCYRVGIRMDEPSMPSLLMSIGRPGFYFRVLEEGEVGAGDEITKVRGPEVHVTVAEVDALLYSPDHPRDRMERALRIPALSPDGGGRSKRCCGSGRRAIQAWRPRDRPSGWSGFRSLAVANGAECAGVLSLSFGVPMARHCRRLWRGSTWLCVFSGPQAAAAVSQLLALGQRFDGALSNQREDRAGRGGGKLPRGSMSGRAMLSTSARRAGASFSNPASGRWCC